MNDDLRMGSKFPLLKRILFSDGYRSLVATSLVLAMIWSLNDPRRGGWLAWMALGVWFGMRIVQKRAIRWHPLLLLGLAYGLYLSIPKSTETSIPMYYIATTTFWMALTYVLLIYDTTGGYLKKRHWENAVMLTGAIVVIQMIYELLDWFWYYQTWSRSLPFAAPQISYRISGGFTYHANNLAALLNTFWPLVLVRIVYARSNWTRLLYGTYLVLILVVLVATNSRGGILATMSMAGLILVYFLLEKYPAVIKKPAALWASIPRREKLLGGFILVGLLGIVVFIFWRAAFTGTQATGLGSRNLIWGNSLTAALKSPLLGSGAGSFVLQYSQAAGLPPGFVAPDAHNLELQTFVISGVVGLIFLLAACYLILRTFIHVIRRLAGRERVQFVLPSMFFVGLLVHNQFDYSLEDSPANTIFYVIMVALFLAVDWQNQRPRPIRTWAAVVAVLGLLFAVSLFGLQSITKGQSLYEKDLVLISEANWEDAYPPVCEVAETNPNNQFYKFQCSLLKSLAGIRTYDEKLLADALAIQKTAVGLNPWWPVNRANLAGLLWWSGERELALNEIQSAVESAPKNAALSLNYGLMSDQLGKNADAESAFLSAMVNNPMLVGNPRFNFSDSWQAAQVSLNQLVYSIDHWEDFMRVFPDAPFTTEESWNLWRGLAAAQSGDLNFGRNILLNQLKQNPDGVWVNVYTAYVLQQLGDSENAQKYAEIARITTERNLTGAGALYTGNTSAWLAPAIIGHVFRENVCTRDAKNALLLSYDLLTSSSTSTGYDRFVYYNNAPLWDLSPTLEWGILWPGLEADFRWLVEALSQDGDQEKAQRVDQWLKIQALPSHDLP